MPKAVEGIGLADMDCRIGMAADRKADAMARRFAVQLDRQAVATVRRDAAGRDMRGDVLGAICAAISTPTSVLQYLCKPPLKSSSMVRFIMAFSPYCNLFILSLHGIVHAVGAV